MGGWKDQFKNCFAVMEVQSDRNATKDHIKSYEATKYQGLINQGLILCFKTYSNQQNSSSKTDCYYQRECMAGLHLLLLEK